MTRCFLLSLIFLVGNLPAQDYYAANSARFFEKGYANDTAKLEALNMELLQATVFHETNLRRSKKRQFIYNKNLEKAASFHSNEMLTLEFFSHTNRKNKKYKAPWDRAKKFKAKFEIVGENILEEIPFDYKDNSLFDTEFIEGKYTFYHHNNNEKIRELTYKELAEKIVSSWMHSPGHKANIMDKNYTHLGIGVAIGPNPYGKDNLPTVFVTQLFGGN